MDVMTIFSLFSEMQFLIINFSFFPYIALAGEAIRVQSGNILNLGSYSRDLVLKRGVDALG